MKMLTVNVTLDSELVSNSGRALTFDPPAGAEGYTVITYRPLSFPAGVFVYYLGTVNGKLTMNIYKASTGSVASGTKLSFYLYYIHNSLLAY